MKGKLLLRSLHYALLVAVALIFFRESIVTASATLTEPLIIKGEPTYLQILSWSIEIVDSAADVGEYNALALDSNGRPHISYFDYDNQDLKYAKWTGTNWQIQIIDSSGDVGANNSLDIDAANNPHISYVDSTNCDLKYARWTGSTWQIQTVTSISSMYCSGFPTAIAVEQNGNAHIAYSDSNYFQLKYAHWTGSSWQIETIEEWVSSYDVSLALDSNNHPHIAFDRDNSLKYAWWDNSTWQVEYVTSMANPGESNIGDLSLALDDANNPHIAYNYKVNMGTSGLNYIHKAGGSWQDQPVDYESGVHTGMSVSLALDESERPHISYRNNLLELKYAYFTGSDWIKQKIQDNVCFGGCNTSLGLDGNGNPHISFYEYDIFPYVQGKLKYASGSAELTPTPTSTSPATPTPTLISTPSWTSTPGPMDRFIQLPLVLGNHIPATAMPTATPGASTVTPTATPSPTSNPTSTPTHTLTPTTTACGIGNCDFEQGATVWTEYSQNGWSLILQAAALPVLPHGGSWAAWLGGDYNEIAYLQQSVLVPANLPYLGYWHWIDSLDACGFDHAYIRINDNLVHQYDLCSYENTNGWELHVVNLSDYAGQTVQLQVRVETDGSLTSNLFLDDFAFRATGE